MRAKIDPSPPRTNSRCGARPYASPARGFTLIELTLVILIMSIVTVIGFDTISSFEANQRADRAAREALICFRYARNLAMTTGKTAKVDINVANGTLSVYWKSNGTTYDATPVATSMTSTGTWVLNLNTRREVVGTAVSLNPTTTTAFEYGALGPCAQTGTVRFSYAGRARSLTVASVGDPQLQ